MFYKFNIMYEHTLNVIAIFINTNNEQKDCIISFKF